jgi:hypothetical protein
MDITQLLRGGMFDEESTRGVLRYRIATLDGDLPFDVQLASDTSKSENFSLTIRFTPLGMPGRDPVEQRIGLVTTTPHYGGIRWWFVCPIDHGGRPCGERVGKLYLPAGASLFGCRSCHNLAYRRSPTLASGRQCPSRIPDLFITDHSPAKEAK